MRYIKNTRVYTLEDIRKEYPGVSIPVNGDLTPIGYAEFIETEKPTKEGFYAVEGTPKNNTQVWELVPIVETQEEVKAKALRYLQDTDWVMSYKIAHDLGLSTIPSDSKKWGILRTREDYINTLKDLI